MGRLGVSITKSISFRGAAQEFSNTYYYETPGTPTAAIASDIIGLLVNHEKTFHASTVTFVRARAWTAGGTKAENNMLVESNLTGNGSQPPNGSGLDKERAILVRFRAGNDSRGRPVYLRKWWHIDVAAIAGTNLSTSQLANVGQLQADQRQNMVDKANFVKDLVPTAGGGAHMTLVSDKGRAITGDTVCHPYIEHHQLGDMWR